MDFSGREVGRFWEVLVEGKNIIKIYCIKLEKHIICVLLMGKITHYLKIILV